MPSRIIVERLCDLCYVQEKEVESVETVASPFSDDGLLVCLDHAQTVGEAVQSLKGLFAFATETVEKPKPPKRKYTQKPVPEGERIPCLVCEHTSSSQQALVQHGRVKHGLMIADMRAQGFAV